LSSQRRVLIIIHDQNDCLPKFSQTNYQFRLSESTPIGFFIGQVQANDRDVSPEFRRLQYQLIDTENNHIVELDSNNGSLYILRKLSAGMTFNMTVMAIDRHNQSLHDQATIEIILYDDATCLPSFTQVLYLFNTSEQRTAPYEIGKPFEEVLNLEEIAYHQKETFCH
jgi:hypothetical protein